MVKHLIFDAGVTVEIGLFQKKIVLIRRFVDLEERIRTHSRIKRTSLEFRFFPNSLRIGAKGDTSQIRKLREAIAEHDSNRKEDKRRNRKISRKITGRIHFSSLAVLKRRKFSFEKYHF